MNLYSTTYPSPIGTIVLESDGTSLTDLRFEEQESGESLNPINPINSNAINPINSAALNPVLTETIHWLDAYFAGNQPRILPRLNPRGTDFQKRVWTALFTIDYGQTTTYGELAQLIGCRSPQAVGQALTHNPIALLIPCHRVLASHGQIGGYAYGPERKRQLLRLESQ